MKKVKWNEYNKVLKKVYEEIRLKQFNNIIAIGRGGSIIGAYLASKLGIPTFYPIFLRHIRENGDKRIDDVSPETFTQIKSLKGRTLIVDDFLRDGLAMKHVLEQVSKDSIPETLVLYNSKDSEFKPDTIGKIVEDTKISFPYEVF